MREVKRHLVNSRYGEKLEGDKKAKKVWCFYKEFIKSKKEKCDELYGDIGGVKRAKMGNWSSEDDETNNTLVARRKRRKKTEKNVTA